MGVTVPPATGGLISDSGNQTLLPAQSFLPAMAGARAGVEGYDPKLHDPYLDRKSVV